jgi:hypothetical protein
MGFALKCSHHEDLQIPCPLPKIDKKGDMSKNLGSKTQALHTEYFFIYLFLPPNPSHLSIQKTVDKRLTIFFLRTVKPSTLNLVSSHKVRILNPLQYFGIQTSVKFLKVWKIL